MKQRKFFNLFRQSLVTQKKEQMKSEFSQHFGSLYEKPKSRFVGYIRQNPRKSFAAMILLLCMNFCLMLYIDTRNVKLKKDPFSNFGDYITKTPLVSPEKGRIDPSIENIMALREIQDSLKYFSTKEHLKSSADTLTLKRLLRKYAAIDPSIFKQ